MSTILVLGASGTVGRPLAEALTRAGHTVRAARRVAAAPGDVAVDLVTGDGLAQAMSGVDAAFLMSPPGHTNQHVLLGRAIDAARRAGVRKVVLMSAMGADADPSVPLRRAELALEQSSLAWNVIRPNWFMQNFNSYWLAGIRAAGLIQLPTGSAKGSFIDARDIADVAAALLTSSTHDGQAFDLTGGESLDHAAAAAALTAATGRDIRYEDVAPETLRAQLLAAGLPADYTESLLVILHYFKLGAAERITDAVPRIAGKAPRTFAQYAADYRTAFV